MGYTHYWWRPLHLPHPEWRSFIQDWSRVSRDLRHNGMQLSDPFGGRSAVISEALVAFNSATAPYEPFILFRTFERPDRARPDGRFFSFCKTERLPYDTAVTACLFVAKRWFVDVLTVATDGEDADWQAARDLCQRVVGYGESYRVAYDDTVQSRILTACRAQAV